LDGISERGFVKMSISILYSIFLFYHGGGDRFQISIEDPRF
jgi:hypothetical protein